MPVVLIDGREFVPDDLVQRAADENRRTLNSWRCRALEAERKNAEAQHALNALRNKDEISKRRIASSESDLMAANEELDELRDLHNQMTQDRDDAILAAAEAEEELEVLGTAHQELVSATAELIDALEEKKTELAQLNLKCARDHEIVVRAREFVVGMNPQLGEVDSIRVKKFMRAQAEFLYLASAVNA